MGTWPELGARIKQRLVEIGYKQKNGKPDVLGFSLKHQYVPMYVYKWASDTTPSRENLERLAADLKCSAAWLLFGGVDKAPTNPRKRGGTKLVWLLAALGLGTMGVVPVEGRTLHSCAISLESLLSEVLKLLRRLGILPDTGITPVIGTYPDTGFRVFPDSSFPDLRAAWAA